MTSSGYGATRSRRPIRAAMACLTLFACVSGRASRIPAEAPTQDLRLTNATPDHVTVYLTVSGERPWRLGDVDGFRTASLPLPVYDARSNARLLVVPVGASRTGKAALEDIDRTAWSSLSEPTEDILAAEWTLVGHQLFSIPRRPGARALPR